MSRFPSYIRNTTEKNAIHELTTLSDENNILDGRLLREVQEELGDKEELAMRNALFFNIFKKDHSYGPGLKTRTMSEKNKQKLAVILRDKERFPYMDMIEQAFTIYLYHSLLKKYGYDTNLHMYNYDAVKVYKTSVFDDTFRGIDYIVCIDGKYVAIDLYLGDSERGCQQKELFAYEAKDLDFFTVPEGKNMRTMPRKVLWISGPMKDFLFCFTNNFFDRISQFRDYASLLEAIEKPDTDPDGFLNIAGTEDIISIANEDFLKASLEYPDIGKLSRTKKSEIAKNLESYIGYFFDNIVRNNEIEDLVENILRRAV